MKILVVGSGGREHALVWKLAQDERVCKLYAAPGNGGMAGVAECLPIGAEDIVGLASFAEDAGIDLTVVGPEGPLAQGLVDRFQAMGLKAFGPTKAAAELEWSKAFARDLMAELGIPAPRYRTFSDYQSAREYLARQGVPIVVKADGLAAGKGVIVCRTGEEAEAALRAIMVERAFGAAGDRVVIEEYLAGEELTVLAFSDGETVVPMVAAQDHKPVYDGDRGPNTGGMGSYAPAPIAPPRLVEEAMAKVLVPAVRGMAERGWPYKGVLYAGLMVTQEGPKALEFNCRFGDPEAQAILPLMEGSLLEVMEACLEGSLDEVRVRWKEGACVCVVLASGGYPGNYHTGFEISGLDEVQGDPDTLVFHAGTKLQDGKMVTSGGRVLGVTGVAPSIAQAVERAYHAVGKLHFAGMHYRTDIGAKALRRKG